MKRIDTVTAVTTVVVSAREERDYQPPQAPTFESEIRLTWQDSLESLLDFGKAILIAFIVIIPWLPFVIVAAFLVWRFFRRRKSGR